MKNPYNLIEKANDTFNLYLDKYDQIENHIENSKKERVEIKQMLKSYLEQINFYQNKSDTINDKFADLFQILINENGTNRALIQKLIKDTEYNANIIKNAESNINSRNNEIISNQNLIIELVKDLSVKLDNIGSFINIPLSEINDNMNINFNEIKKSILNSDDLLDIKYGRQLGEIRSLGDSVNELFIKNNDLISEGSDKQLGEIRSLGDSVNELFIKNNDLISAGSDKQLGEIRSLGDSVNELFIKNDNLIKDISHNQDINLQNHDNIQKIINYHQDMGNKLNNAIDLFVLNYEECKKCFFNDNEYLLKKYMDTDDLFRMCYFNNIQFLSYSPFENKILLKTKEGIILASNNRFYTIKEVIGFDGYSVPQLYQFDDFVVFDIGMNRAYASLRFAEFSNCSNVYGFEIDEDTYEKAIYNINLNPNLSHKIKTYNFGLSNKEEELELYYLEGADGVNTIVSDLIDIQYEMKKNKDNIQSKLVKVKKASEIIGDIIKNEKINSKIVLKIDTEGSEYDIIDDLIGSGLIYKMDLIVGEGHKFNDRNLSKDLRNIGFKEILRKDNEIVYNFAFIKEEFNDIWPLKL